MPALFAALLTTAFDAMGNVVDGKISRSMGLHAIVFYGTMANAVFLPLFLAFGFPGLPASGAAWAAVALSGAVWVAYLYPYTRALSRMDTSVVAALFSLGKLLIPVLAFFIAGESLPGGLYAGFFLIIGSTVALSLGRGTKGWKLNSAFWLMLGCSAMLATNNVVIKSVLKDDTDWLTYLFWTQAVSTAIAAGLLALPAYRRAVLAEWAGMRAHGGKFALQSFLAVCGTAAGVHAIGVAPVTFATGVESSQPLMVLLFSLAISALWPKFLDEKLDWRAILRKSAFYACMVAGVVAMTLKVGG